MKICGYENMKCLLCGRNDMLADCGRGEAVVTITNRKEPMESRCQVHYVSCVACTAEFFVPCTD